MIRPKILLASLSLVLLASCGPQTATVSTVAPKPTATPPPLAHEIRFALIGSVTDVNVWALFDAKGYSYNNYAVRSGYWPRLYQLSIPDRQFIPMAASGMPSAVQQEGSFYAATVPLRTDLEWTDGSPFTADDVAFTVNTVLSFQLGFDWRDYYDPDYLDHAQAVDSHTVKFYFKKMPNVGVWQYGALQGPIVQKAFWSSKIAASMALLPPSDLAQQIESKRAQVADLQKQYDALLLTPIPPNQIQQAQLNISRQQNNLNQANGDLAKAQSGYDAAMTGARDSLYALNDNAEPLLGAWQADPSQKDFVANIANPKFPFGHPAFEQSTYNFYANENAAISAWMKGEVDSILDPGGISVEGFSQISGSQKIASSPNSDLRFLVFNSLNPELNDPVLRQALACVIDGNELIGQLNSAAAPLDSFVLPDQTFWFAANASLPCKSMDSASRLGQAVNLLKSAGYKWTREPSGNSAGQGLASPNGSRLPSMNLIAPSSDNVKMKAASYIQQQARLLGILLTSTPAASDQINYAVFSSHQYDMALLGWNVSEYPSYLCDWFGNGNPFGYNGSSLQSACEALNSTSDLAMAQKQAFEIQSILAQDLPFIPLYSGITYDAYRNISYPFTQILGGLSGVYGAPSLAIPTLH